MNIDKEELKQANEFIKSDFDRIVEWIVGDVKKACRFKEDGTCDDNGALVGAFILWVCAIDYFGGLLTGATTGDGLDQRYEQFTKKYLLKYGKYNWEDIRDLRWKLVHYYTVKGFVLFHESNRSDSHLKKSNKGCVFHLWTSVKHLELAVADFKEELLANPKKRIVAWNYWKIHPVAKPMKEEELVISTEDFN